MTALPFRLLTPALVLSLFGCGGLVGNGKVTTEARTVGAFTKLEVASGIRATLSSGPRAISVTTDENLVDSIETVLRGDTLVVRTREPIGRARQLNVDITNEVLDSVSASGRSKIRGLCTGGTNVVIEASGGSTIEFTDLAANSLKIDDSGGSEITLGGAATQIDLNVSGGSKFTSTSLKVQTVKLDVSGGSDVKLIASGSVDGEASGGAVVSISGGPSTHVNSSGGSVVTSEN